MWQEDSSEMTLMLMMSRSPLLLSLILRTARFRSLPSLPRSEYQRARDQVVAGISPVEMLFPFGGIAPLSVVGLSELPESVQRE